MQAAIADPVNKLLEGLRGAEDRIDLVVVMGGSPADVADALRKARPFLPVYCPAEATGQAAPMFANVRGFQEWAEAVDQNQAMA